LTAAARVVDELGYYLLAGAGGVGPAALWTRRATAATNHNTRHPVITGWWATTMHRLSGGRFTMGIGRGVPQDSYFGIP
jgi:hypothetical protein